MLWGGRFNKKIDKSALGFSSSLKFDINLFEEDILVNLAHSEMLFQTGIISEEDFASISNGLMQLKSEFINGSWIPNPDVFEDIHSAIEMRLTEIIGETANKLHTGRSRNDQIATDEKLWIKKSSFKLINLLTLLQKSCLDIASKHINTIIPGYTHLQRAQPISLAFHFLAYIEMFERDKNRFNFVINETDQCPLGSGALAGSTLPFDREFTSKKLKFSSTTKNALDSVSDRDFIVDFLNATAIGMIHLSKLAEELIFWNSQEVSFAVIPEEFTTGSSLMPQKKNPDMLELIRGKSGRVIGNYVSLMTTLKGLPLSYNRDLQEDKEPLFDSFSTYSDSLEILSKIIKGLEFNINKFSDELQNSFILSTDLADWLVLKKVPFRQAHKIVGEVVRYCEEKGIYFNQISLDELQKISPKFDESVFNYLDLKTSLEKKKTTGSPNPEKVKAELIFWQKKLSEED